MENAPATIPRDPGYHGKAQLIYVILKQIGIMLTKMTVPYNTPEYLENSQARKSVHWGKLVPVSKWSGENGYQYITGDHNGVHQWR